MLWFFSCSVTKSCPPLWDPRDCSRPGLPVLSIPQSLLKFVPTELAIPSNQLDLISVIQFSSVQPLSRLWLFVTPWTAARQASLSITNSWSLLKPMPVESVMPSNHLILCRPLLLSPSIFPSIWVFSNESVLHIKWPKYWSSASMSVLPMNIQDWFPLGWTGWISLQSKGLLRVFSKTTVQKNQFFSAQLSLYSNSHIHTWLLEKL